MRKVFLSGNYPLVDFQLLQESPFLANSVEVKESLKVGVPVP